MILDVELVHLVAVIILYFNCCRCSIDQRTCLTVCRQHSATWF